MINRIMGLVLALTALTIGCGHKNSDLRPNRINSTPSSALLVDFHSKNCVKINIYYDPFYNHPDYGYSLRDLLSSSHLKVELNKDAKENSDFSVLLNAVKKMKYTPRMDHTSSELAIVFSFDDSTQSVMTFNSFLDSGTIDDKPVDFYDLDFFDTLKASNIPLPRPKGVPAH